MQSPRVATSIAPAAGSGGRAHHAAAAHAAGEWGAGDPKPPADGADSAGEHSACSSVPDSEPAAAARGGAGAAREMPPTVSAAHLMAAARELNAALAHARQARPGASAPWLPHCWSPLRYAGVA